MTDQVNRSTTT